MGGGGRHAGVHRGGEGSPRCGRKSGGHVRKATHCRCNEHDLRVSRRAAPAPRAAHREGCRAGGERALKVVREAVQPSDEVLGVRVACAGLAGGCEARGGAVKTKAGEKHQGVQVPGDAEGHGDAGGFQVDKLRRGREQRGAQRGACLLHGPRGRRAGIHGAAARVHQDRRADGAGDGLRDYRQPREGAVAVRRGQAAGPDALGQNHQQHQLADDLGGLVGKRDAAQGGVRGGCVERRAAAANLL